MRLRSHPPDKRSGVAAVEFAVVLIFLAPLLIGVWEIGRGVHAYQIVMTGARETARRAATGVHTKSEIQQIALTYFQTAGFTAITGIAATESDVQSGGKVHVEIKVYDKSGTLLPDADPKIDAQQLYKLEINVTLLYNDVEYSPTDYFLPSTFMVSATGVWNSMKDIPVTVSGDIPLY